MFELFKISPSLPEEWKKRFLQVTWEYRDVYGQDLMACSGGIAKFAVHIARNGAPLKAAKQRSCSKYSKELFNMVIKCYIDANIVKYTSESALCNAFLVAKTRPPVGTPPMKTLEDLQNPDIQPHHISSSWRLILDMSASSRASHDFFTPIITPREVMQTFTKGKIFVTLDVLNFFYQCLLSKRCRYMTAFQSASNAASMMLTRTAQGHSVSAPCDSLILKLILNGVLKEHFNYVYIDNIMLSNYNYSDLFDDYVTTLKRAREFNVVLKASDVVFGYKTDHEAEFSVLGMSVSNGRLKIPRKKVADFSPSEFPRNKRSLIRLLGNTNFYSNFSSAFSETAHHLREEMKLQSGKKFIFTNRMEKLTKCLLEIIQNSNGLYILSREQYIKNTFLLFVDSSKFSYGATILCLVGDELWPIVAISKAHTQNARNWCANRAELMSIIYASNDLRLFLTMKPHFVVTDSSFARYCLTKPIAEIGSKMQGAVLIYREQFFSRVLKIPGNLHTVPDALSRYCIPSAASNGILTEQDRKIIKWHMDATKIDPALKASIEEQTEYLVNPNHVTVEDEIAKTNQESVPACYSITDYASDKFSCDGSDICCNFNHGDNLQNNINILDSAETRVTNLKTIHKIDPSVRNEFKDRLSLKQLSQLDHADYVIIESSADVSNPPIQTVPKTKMSEHGISELKISGPHDVSHANCPSCSHTTTHTVPQMVSNANDGVPAHDIAHAESHQLPCSNIPCDAGLIPHSSYAIPNACPQIITPFASANVANPVANPVTTPITNPVTTPIGNPVATPIANPVTNPVTTPMNEKIDEQISSVAVIERPEDEPDQIGTNDYEILPDGRIEVWRDFSRLPLDNIAYIAAALKHHIVEDSALTDNDESCDDIRGLDNDISMQSEGHDSSDTESHLDVVVDNSWHDDIHGNNDNCCFPLIGTRRTKRPRGSSSESNEDDKNKNSRRRQRQSDSQPVETSDAPVLSQRQKVVNEQQKDPDTKTIIECVQLGVRPERHEIRQESQFMNEIMEEFDTLSIVNGELRKQSLDASGNSVSLLVLPESIAKETFMNMHVAMAHSHVWRLENILGDIYFYPKMSSTLRNVYKSCMACVLSQNPTIQRTRKITVSDSFPTREINVDLLYLKPHSGFKYAFVLMSAPASAWHALSGQDLARKLHVH